VTAVHDVSDGGLLVALAEMAMASGIGAQLEFAWSDVMAPHAYWFGEDQGRYVVTASSRHAIAKLGQRARDLGVSFGYLGMTGGDTLTIPGERPILVSTLRQCFEAWLPAYMAGGPG